MLKRKWGVFEHGRFVHVAPVLRGTRLLARPHKLKFDCFCLPSREERGVNVIYVHHIRPRFATKE